MNTEEKNIVPPRESTSISNQDNIVPPRESTKMSYLQKSVKAVREYGIYSYLYFFIISVMSLFLLDNENYLKEIFPVSCYIGFVILLLTHLSWSNKLNFCKYKKLSTVSLILYFLSCIMAVIFNLDLYSYFAYFFIASSVGFIVFDIKNKRKLKSKQ